MVYTAYQRQWYLDNRDAILARDAKRYRENKPAVQAYNRARYQKFKMQVAAHYSDGEPQCAYCGDTWFPGLSIDHLHGDGHKHRCKGGRRTMGVTLLKWIIDNDYPPDYQILCGSCNQVKRNMSDKEFRQRYPERLVR